MTSATWVFALLSISCSAFAQLSMKVGMTAVRDTGHASTFDTIVSAMTSPFVIGGLGLYGVGAGLWLAVLSQVPLSMAYPIVSLGFVMVAVLAWTLLGESLPPLRIAGIAVICAGVLMVGRT